MFNCFIVEVILATSFLLRYDGIVKRFFHVICISLFFLYLSPFALGNYAKVFAIISLRLPTEIYVGDRIPIDYTGAKKGECYAIFTEPAIGLEISRITGVGCAEKINSKLFNVGHGPS